MSDSVFRIDDSTVRAASRISRALHEAHLKAITSVSRDAISLDYAQKTPELWMRAVAPLKEISQEIAVSDLLEDVRDFAMIAAMANFRHKKVVAVRVGESNATLPLLPPAGVIEAYRGHLMIGPFFWPEIALERNLFQLNFARDVLLVSLREAQDSFFAGLPSFLAARIAGVRWSMRQRDSGRGSGGGSGQGSSLSGGGASAQLWEINTRNSGLSLAYHGTHAARTPTALAGGVTTPVNVYLPMGTLYIGANAGPSGSYTFDYGAALTVPDSSAFPSHTTKVF